MNNIIWYLLYIHLPFAIIGIPLAYRSYIIDTMNTRRELGVCLLSIVIAVLLGPFNYITKPLKYINYQLIFTYVFNKIIRINNNIINRIEKKEFEKERAKTIYNTVKFVNGYIGLYTDEIFCLDYTINSPHGSRNVMYLDRDGKYCRVVFTVNEIRVKRRN